MLLFGIYALPVAMLQGSLFTTFTVPALALSLVVGGSAIVANVLLLRRSPHGFVAAATAGLAVMIFEAVQVISIGSPPGPAQVMQASYFALGLLLLVLAAVGLRAGRAASHWRFP